MAKSELAFRINKSRTAVIIRLLNDGEEIDRWEMEAPELDEHIRDLANQRAQLADEVPQSLDPGARVTDAVFDPPVNATVSGEHFVMAYRHPGLGWLALGLTRARAEELSRKLEDWPRQ